MHGKRDIGNRGTGVAVNDETDRRVTERVAKPNNENRRPAPKELDQNRGLPRRSLAKTGPPGPDFYA